MLNKVALLTILVGYCLSQQTAKLKCEEYAARATSQQSSPQCKALSDGKSGVKIEPTEFPATAMLGYVVASGEVRYICDATLISDDTLIAAGHCLHQKAYGNPKWVRLGATSTTLGVEVEVKDSVCHPEYSPGNDIALIKLKQKLNSSFIPACLDTEGIEEGVHGVGVGRPIGNAYIELREKCPVKSKLDVRPSQECVDVFPQQNINKDATLCTKDPASGPGDCLSGPLYVPRQTCVHTVAGIASFGKPCYNKTSEGRTPSVYTRVSHYLPWIESLTWPTNQPSSL